MEAVAVVIIVFFLFIVCLVRPETPLIGSHPYWRHKHNWQRKDTAPAPVHIQDGPWICYCGATKPLLSLEELVGR